MAAEHAQGIARSFGIRRYESPAAGSSRIGLFELAQQSWTHRPCLAVQIALREVDAIVEKLGNRALVLDLVDDQLEIEGIEVALHVGAPQAFAPHLHIVEEGLGVDLDEAEVPIAKTGEIDIEVADMVERKTVAERA